MKVYRSDDLYLGDKLVIDKDTILIGKRVYCPDCKLCIGMQIQKDDNGFPIPPIEFADKCPYNQFRNA